MVVVMAVVLLVRKIRIKLLLEIRIDLKIELTDPCFQQKLIFFIVLF